MNCNSYKDDRMLGLTTKVLRLANVFANFKTMCTTDYELNARRDLTSPWFARDAMLLMTGMKLDLITDFEMLGTLEKEKRGWICYIGMKSNSKANINKPARLSFE